MSNIFYLVIVFSIVPLKKHSLIYIILKFQQQQKNVSTAIHELQTIKSMHPDEYQKVEVLRTKFERQVQQTTEHEVPNVEAQKHRIDELLQRKAQIIARKIDSDTAARGAINEMQMINVALVHLNGRN